MTNDESIDYKALCWKLVDCMNAAWRKKTGEGSWHYTFEFLPANEIYLYTSGLVAQIVVYNKHIGLVAVVQSKIGGIVTKGCETDEEAFKSMIENYLVKVSRKDAQTWFDDADLAVVFEDNMSRKERKMEFKVGDKVIIHSYDCNGYYFGKHGTIAEANPLGNYRIKIEETGSYDWFAGSDLSRDIRGVEPRMKGSDVWHVNLAELEGRTVSGCKGLAFGEEV